MVRLESEMYRFFVSEEQLNSDDLYITGNDYNHIRNVLRMKPGDEVLLCDGKDREYVCTIIGFSEAGGGAVKLMIADILGQSRELPAKITLFQGYPKGDKMEQIVQKAVELGVYEIVPVMMKRSVVKFDDNKSKKKVERLNAIALSAAKQSKRGIIPVVTDVMSMESAVMYAKNLDYVIIPYENAKGMDYSRRVLSEAVGKNTIGVFIGPEGGFDNSEVESVTGIYGKVISLGNRILRTETAGPAILGLLMYMLED